MHSAGASTSTTFVSSCPIRCRRAGRDGKPAQCTLLYDFHDRRTQQFFLLNRYPTAADVEAVYRELKEAKESAVQAEAADELQEPAAASRKSVSVNKRRVAAKLLRDAGLIAVK